MNVTAIMSTSSIKFQQIQNPFKEIIKIRMDSIALTVKIRHIYQCITVQVEGFNFSIITFNGFSSDSLRFEIFFTITNVCFIVRFETFLMVIIKPYLSSWLACCGSSSSDFLKSLLMLSSYTLYSWETLNKQKIDSVLQPSNMIL